VVTVVKGKEEKKRRIRVKHFDTGQSSKTSRWLALLWRNDLTAEWTPPKRPTPADEVEIRESQAQTDLCRAATPRAKL